MTGNTWQHIDSRPRIGRDAKIRGWQINGAIYRQRKWRTAQLYRVNAEQQVMHHRIANQHNFHNIVTLQPGLFSGAIN